MTRNATKAAAEREEKKESRFMTVFDVIFVLLLCVCILLVTMLVQKRLPAADGYSITWTAVLALGAVAGLFVFIIVNSSKEWRGMIRSLYGEDAEGTGKEDK